MSPPSEPPDTESAQQLTRRFDEGAATPTTAIIEPIETHADSDLSDLPPLNDSTDPDALNTLLANAPAPADGTQLQVGFAYAGSWVTVRSSGSVTVTSTQINPSHNG